MKHSLSILAAAAVLALSGPASAQSSGWVFTPAAEGRGPQLAFGAPGAGSVHYDFRCADGSLTATQTGVTELMDMQTGTKVPDTGLNAAPAGASFMAIANDRGVGDLLPAKAMPNPVRGWDISLTLPLTHASVKALARAKGMSLMTTGMTTLVALSPADRSTLSAFLKACKSA
jgi:hypothetical protein